MAGHATRSGATSLALELEMSPFLGYPEPQFLQLN